MRLPLLSILCLACTSNPGEPDSPSFVDVGEEAGPSDGSLGDRALPQDAPLGDTFVRDGRSRDAARTDTGAPPPLPPAQAPPPAPTFPSTIGTLSVGIRTASGRTSDTSAPQEICISDSDCFTLDLPDVDDFREGEVDVYHFEGVGISRSSADRMTVGTLSDPDSNNDRWTIECIDVRFDGEPVYCNDGLDRRIGTGGSSGESAYWTDPEGLHVACTTCQAGTLTHGPMQGAHEDETLRVWVRTDATRRVGLRLGVTPDLRDAPVSAWTYPTPENDFAGVLEARGLQAGGVYYYQVEIDGSPAGGVHTARPTRRAAERIRFAFGSCTKDRSQPIFGPLARESLDLFLFVGDNHYGNTPHVEAHRYHYRWQRSLDARAEFIAEVSTIATWDDHDFVGNNTDATCVGVDDALRGFGENWANGPRPNIRGVFHEHRQGPAHIFMLDCRTHRPPASSRRRCETDPDAPAPRPEYGLLGLEQTQWLLGELEGSDAPFKFLACGSRWTRHGSSDSWDSFLDARDRLFAEIRSRSVEGVVLLSGDIHETDLRVVSRDGAYDFPELTSSPLGRDATFCGFGDSERRFCFDDTSSYVVAEIDASLADPTLRVTVHNVRGESVHEWVIAHSELR